MDTSGTLCYYASSSWKDVLEMAERRLALDPYQELPASDDVKGDIRKELVVAIDYLINLLEQQGCRFKDLPIDWKDYPTGALFEIFKSMETACRSRLLKKIKSGTWAGQSLDIPCLQRLLEEQSVPDTE